MKKINFEKMYDELKLTSNFNDAVLIFYNTTYKDMLRRKTIKENEKEAFEYLKIMVANLEEAINEKKKV